MTKILGKAALGAVAYLASACAAPQVATKPAAPVVEKKPEVDLERFYSNLLELAKDTRARGKMMQGNFLEQLTQGTVNNLRDCVRVNLYESEIGSFGLIVSETTEFEQYRDLFDDDPGMDLLVEGVAAAAAAVREIDCNGLQPQNGLALILDEDNILTIDWKTERDRTLARHSSWLGATSPFERTGTIGGMDSNYTVTPALAAMVSAAAAQH